MKKITFAEGGWSEKSVGLIFEKGKLIIWATDVDSYIRVELTKDQLKALKELVKDLK